MDSTLIATTANAELQALGTGGQLVVQAWDQLANHLRRTLGAAHAGLFAEPNPDPDRGTTDWYAEGDGPALTLAAVPEPGRQAAQAELTRLVDDIRAESEKLRASARSGDRFLGDLLALALQVPDEASVRVVGGRPVLVAWGYAPVGAPARPELLLGLLWRPVAGRAPGELPMRIVGPPPAPPPRDRGAWAWLALPLPLLLLLLLWFDPFRWFEAPAAQCLIPTAGLPLLDDLRREEGRESALRAEAARLTQQLGDRRVACPPPPGPPPRPAAQRPAPVPTPAPAPAPPRTADADRAREQGARTGRLQIILAWDDQNDLDLMVTCPSGQRIFFNQRRACGGELDVDQNYTPPFTPRGVENIVFSDAVAPGRYAVTVLHSGQRPPAPRTSAFRVTVRQEGQPDRVTTGTVSAGTEVAVTTVDVAPR